MLLTCKYTFILEISTMTDILTKKIKNQRVKLSNHFFKYLIMIQMKTLTFVTFQKKSIIK
jgi:hypothetical protein